MSKRKLLIEVDCGKRRCKRCAHVGCGPEPYCEPFDAECALDAKGRSMRLPACLAAERDAAPRKALRRVLITDADDPADNGVYDLVRTESDPRPIASREVPADLSSMWGDVKCEPIAYTFTGKVKS